MKLAGNRKITTGWVTQVFDPATGKCIGQEFTAGDTVEYEDETGKRLEPDGEEYFPFDMIQPADLNGLVEIDILEAQLDEMQVQLDNYRDKFSS
jgi:hypothetical protein